MSYKKINTYFFLIIEPYVFTDKKLALLKLKTIKDARLNTFKTNDEAIKFSQDGFQGLPATTHTFPKGL